MVECIEPYQGRVYDPACGSGGMFIQSLKFVQEHQGNINNISIYGQEKNPTTWRLAKMNLAIRSLNGDLGKYAADTFTEDLHKDLKADFVLANPPFNLEWDVDKVSKDPRWRYGLAPKTNANYAWLQHMISKLSQNGKMACILANGSLTAGGAEYEIRKKLIENDLVECIISMPSSLFYTVSVSCCIWIINRNKKQKNSILFINANKLGEMVTRKLRELSSEDILKIANSYHEYQNSDDFDGENGFSKKMSTEDVINNECILKPGSYVETIDDEEDPEEVSKRIKLLVSQLKQNFAESEQLSKEIEKVLGAIGYEM